MFAKNRHISLKIDTKVKPEFRYAIGATLIMGFTMAFGGQLSFIIPFLSLNFLSPGTKMPQLKQAISFVLIVSIASFSSLIFNVLFFNYLLVYIPLLSLILFGIFYTTSLSLLSKIFFIISFLATPVPYPDMNIGSWAIAITTTLILGSALSILVVWVIYAIFPDPKDSVPEKKKNAQINNTSQKERIFNAVSISIVTLPIVFAFIFFQWNDYILILIYIVIFTMLTDMGKIQGKIKIYGNIIGGIATIIFYNLIMIVPLFSFFILLYFGTALLFSSKIFSSKQNSVFYKTGFSTLTLIIGDISIGTENASNEIWLRILQIFIAVIYVITVLEIINHYQQKNIKNLTYE